LRAYAALAVSVLVWLAWGLFNDAAAHGWQDLKYFDDPMFWITLVLGGGVVAAAIVALDAEREEVTVPPADWYPDPEAPDAQYRYWNGGSWTGHRAPR
jgi:Protein of unknown function (DUF2510)